MMGGKQAVGVSYGACESVGRGRGQYNEWTIQPGGVAGTCEWVICGNSETQGAGDRVARGRVGLRDYDDRIGRTCEGNYGLGVVCGGIRSCEGER